MDDLVGKISRYCPTLALSDVANGVEEECVVCRMIVRADQVEHPVLGFKARCEK